MKKLKIPVRYLLIASVMFAFSSCYKLQTDYNYVKKTLDPNINKTALQFLKDRSDSIPTDTVFKWMKKGIEYAGIDMAEYSKPGRTYVFLHNDAIKVWDSKNKKVTGGFFFDMPIVEKDANGNNIIDPTTNQPKTHPALDWSEYSKETVKNYLLSLIVDGVYGFDNVTSTNTSVKTLLPAGTNATKESKLGYVVTSNTPNPDATAKTAVVVIWDNETQNRGFDPEGKLNFIYQVNANTPIRVNDRTDDRSAGYITTNGQVHVYGATVYPFRYSHL